MQVIERILHMLRVKDCRHADYYRKASERIEAEKAQMTIFDFM